MNLLMLNRFIILNALCDEKKNIVKNCIAFMLLKLQKQQNENNKNLHYLFLRRRFVVCLLLNFRIKFDVRSNSFFENH